MSKLVDKDKIFQDKFKFLRRDLEKKETAYLKAHIRWQMVTAGHPEAMRGDFRDGERIYNERYNKKTNTKD